MTINIGVIGTGAISVAASAVASSHAGVRQPVEPRDKPAPYN